MATVTPYPRVPRQSPTPPPDAPHLTLEISRPSSAPIPNKHLPFCPPGPAPTVQQQAPNTPPDTPPSKGLPASTYSILQPAASFPKISDAPSVYSINASTLADALEETATQPSPGPQYAFPWLHGLHDQNQMQLAFFAARRKTQRNPPKCLRGITLVKAGPDLSKSRLKGAVGADEILGCGRSHDASSFLEVDPREGFSVRNFQIQVAKMAMVSDIIVYGDDETRKEEVSELGRRLARAQAKRRVEVEKAVDGWVPTYNTFVLEDSFEDVEQQHSHLVAADSKGEILGHALDFFHLEREEMCTMSKASEIAHNVWLGPTPDTSISPSGDDGSVAFDILIEGSDLATPPSAQTLRRIEQESYASPQTLDFPSSGSLMPQAYPKPGLDPLTRICQWLHKVANRDGTVDTGDDDADADSDGDIPMRNLSPTGRKVLIHCTDGYTESTVLAVAYFMFAEQLPLHEAWLRLHCDKKRNFFAYPSDVALLASQQPALVPPKTPTAKRSRKGSSLEEPSWLSLMDGSLPSRILPYMYLGNLGHANNPELLKAMGIRQILSVGEPISWSSAQIDSWGSENLENVMYVDGVQDNGVDPLMGEFERCLDFLSKGKANSTATLVHCRVGVSRSATICIAEVMASMGLSFPRAYCFVRARRLNVIIQPHLRFAYELLKWDEVCQQRRGESIRREVEWPTLCREIAGMNKPYCSR